MKECWPDGALRAFLDRELPAEDFERLSAHLQECAGCRGRSRELEARAGRVLGMVGALAEPAAVVVTVSRPRTGRPQAGKWVAAAVAVAAGWAALSLLTPPPVHAPVRTSVQAPTAIAAPPPADLPVPLRQGSLDAPLAVHVPGRAPSRSLRRAALPRATLAGFVALDDDPIDAGVVMRVMLAQGQMQADVLYSPDGRPRAFRLVNEATGK